MSHRDFKPLRRIRPRGEPRSEGKEAESGSSGIHSPPKVRIPAYYGRRRRRGDELCQILIANGDVLPVDVRKALKVQEERGGQIGRILVAMGACTERAISRALLEQIQVRDKKGLSQAARENPAIAGLQVQCSPVKTTLALVLSDTFALALAVGCAFVASYLRADYWRLQLVALMIPAAVLCAVAFPTMGLYSAMAQSPADELRSTTSAVTMGFLGVLVVAIFGDRATRLLTMACLLVWWVTAMFLVPIVRAVVRQKLGTRSWWGHPVVVLGAAKTGRLVVRTLQTQPGRGLKPVFLLDDDTSKQGTLRASWTDQRVRIESLKVSARRLLNEGTLRAASEVLETRRKNAGAERPADKSPTSSPPTSSPPSSMAPLSWSPARGQFAEVEGVPIVGDLSLAPVLADRLKIKYAILAMPGIESESLLRIAERVGGVFSHLLIIPDLFGFGSIGVPAKDVGGVIGIEVRQQLLLPGPRLAKRIMDMTLTVLGGLAISPILVLLWLLIRLDSKGSAFYFQKRLGRDGQHFLAAKFRTMHGDGEARLKAVLDSNPAMKAEYEEFHKLSNDPRVTRVGRVLRKYSLDELPQLWNVLRGEMSLVGPRPYLEREVHEMQQKEGIILRAMPGMTGMWQVSDRNATGFAERLKMDVHYVRNWSPWLDVYILARTLGVVVRGTGV
jgi:lipopolysaccharide/colanic/teichoic acid biosynthesis glycosyltransferase